MTNAKHTPGPWKAESNEGRWNVWGGPSAEFLAADCGQESNRHSGANARLIAAAPELLAALRAICEPITVAAPPDAVAACQDLHELICEIAREAIAKAGGQS